MEAKNVFMTSIYETGWNYPEMQPERYHRLDNLEAVEIAHIQASSWIKANTVGSLKENKKELVISFYYREDGYIQETICFIEHTSREQKVVFRIEYDARYFRYLTDYIDVIDKVKPNITVTRSLSAYVIRSLSSSVLPSSVYVTSTMSLTETLSVSGISKYDEYYRTESWTWRGVTRKKVLEVV